jgi:hypothetical protein
MPSSASATLHEIHYLWGAEEDSVLHALMLACVDGRDLYTAAYEAGFDDTTITLDAPPP